MGAATIRQWWVRPSLRRAISPASSSTRRCLETAGSVIRNGSASSVTEDSGAAASLARIARRVGSERAPNVASRAATE